MADPIASYPPPGVDPQQWMQTQRQQMLANALMQSATQPIQQPETAPTRGLYVQPRTNPLQGVAKIAEALMGNRALDKANASYGAGLGKGLTAMAPGGQYQPTGDNVTVQTAPGRPVAPPSSPDEQTVQPLGGTTQPQTAQLPTYQRTPVNPLNPTGMPASIALQAYMQDPVSYFKSIQGTPEWQNALRAAGGDPNRAQQLLLGSQVKAGTTEARAGSWVQGPNGQWLQLPSGGPGQHLSLDPQGNITSSTIPGYNEQAGALESAQTDAKESAQAPYTMVEVPIGGGRTQQMPLTQAMKLYGINPVGGAAPAGPGPSPGAPQPAPQPSAGPPRPGPQAAPPAQAPPQGPPVAPPRPAAPSGAPAQGGIWSTVPKLQIPNTPGVTSDLYTSGNLTAASAKRQELSTQYGQNASLADARIAFNNEALKALQGAETGPLSDTLTQLRARALELGVPAQWIPGADTVGDTQLLKKFALRNPLLNLKPTFGSRPAAAEFQILANDASPSPAMLKPVYAKLAQLDNEQAQYTKQQGTDFSTYTQMGGDPQQFESWYAKARPLARYFAQQATPTTPGRDGLTPLQRLQANPQTLPDFKTTFGWDPTQ
jgi:hypothetical protein